MNYNCCFVTKQIHSFIDRQLCTPQQQQQQQHQTCTRRSRSFERKHVNSIKNRVRVDRNNHRNINIDPMALTRNVCLIQAPAVAAAAAELIAASQNVLVIDTTFDEMQHNPTNRSLDRKYRNPIIIIIIYVRSANIILVIIFVSFCFRK